MGINYILKYIAIENSYFKLYKYFTILKFVLMFLLCIFDYLHAVLVSIRDFSKTKTNSIEPKFEQWCTIYISKREIFWPANNKHENTDFFLQCR